MIAHNAVLRRNLFLIGASACFVLAFANGLSSQTCFQSSRSLIATGSTVFMGYIIACGVRLLADQLLQDPVWPWYARRGATAVLIAASGFLNAVAIGINVQTPYMHNLGNAPPMPACALLLIGVEWLMIPLMDWPSGRFGAWLPRWPMNPHGRPPENDTSSPQNHEPPRFRKYVPDQKYDKRI